MELAIRIEVGIRTLLAKIGVGTTGRVMYIGGSDTLPPPLTKDEEEELILEMQHGKTGARNLLIERNLRLVVYIARRFENTGVGIEDLISIGTIGLIKAVNTYQPEKKIKLATYASRCIENEILMYLRKISGKKGEVSLEEPLNIDWDGNELLLSDILGTEPDVIMKPLEEDAEKKMLLDAVDGLPEREKTIVMMRFGLRGGQERTQKEVADMLGISQSYISRLEKRTFAKLKRDLLEKI